MKLPWILGAAIFAIGGFFGARIGSQSVAIAFETVQPGKQEIQYAQPNLWLGNAIGLFCLVGVGGSLWKATEAKDSKAKESGDRTQKDSTAQPKFLPSQVFRSEQQDQSFDQDIEDFAGLAESVKAIANPRAEVATTADELIFERMFDFRKRHILIPAETGGGKTSLLLGAIVYGSARFPDAEFLISTAKPAPWLGLEDLKARDKKAIVLNVLLNQPIAIEPVLARLQWVQSQLVFRQNERARAEATGKPYNPSRLIVILDEWNQTLAIAHEFDRQSNRDKEKGEPRSNTRDDLLALVTSLLLLGREDEVIVWLVGQGHQVQNAGINSEYQKSFGLLIPGTNGNMLGLESALAGRHPIMPIDQGRRIYQDAVREAEAIALINPQRGVCYSNLRGHEILIPPDLTGIKRRRLFGVGAQEKTNNGNVVQFKRSEKPTVQELPLPETADIWD